MKKIGIVTIYNSNYGNRLQNYALQCFLEKMDYNVSTIKNVSLLNKYKNNFDYFLRNIKFLFKKNDFIDTKKRELLFQQFNKNINTTKYVFNWWRKDKTNDFDQFVIGSDQVWNPYIGRLSLFDVAEFTNKKVISYAASIGASSLEKDYLDILESKLKKLDAISVREEQGKVLLKEKCNLNSDVLIDPTMLLTSKEWEQVMQRPKQYTDEKYILNYFLGDMDLNYKKMINSYANKNNLKVINILDRDDPYYITGPGEFLFLEKNAEIIFTDSFHSSVFAILFDRPFVIFERNQLNHNNMGSRIDTLLNKFKLTERKFNNNMKIEDYIYHNYDEAYKILDAERKKSEEFLKNNLE